MVIWKFNLSLNPHMIIPMPVGSKILSVGCQGDLLFCLWALCDPFARIEDRIVHSVLTGDTAFLGSDKFIGTVMTNHGQFVCHFFDGGSDTQQG